MDVTGKYICKVLQPVLDWSHCNDSGCGLRIASELDAGQKYLCLTRWKLLTWKLSVKKSPGSFVVRSLEILQNVSQW